MNKKLLMFGIPILALALVSAIAVYYFAFSVTLNVNQPISVDGDLAQEVSCEAGETCAGMPITVFNDGTAGEKSIVISNDNTNPNITVSYVSELELTEKTVVFGEVPWVIPGDADKVKLQYTLVGDEFSVEVTNGKLTGYELIYYKDNSDRFNSPAIAIKLSEVTENLPYENDQNADEYDYCAIEGYDTCHGAKIWYVPSTAINGDGSLDWGRASEFFYETALVQYNSEGELVIFPDSSITITPIFEINEYAGDWIGTITTTVA